MRRWDPGMWEYHPGGTNVAFFFYLKKKCAHSKKIHEQERKGREGAKEGGREEKEGGREGEKRREGKDRKRNRLSSSPCHLSASAGRHCGLAAAGASQRSDSVYAWQTGHRIVALALLSSPCRDAWAPLGSPGHWLSQPIRLVRGGCLQGQKAGIQSLFPR